jgi:hypothetical protein
MMTFVLSLLLASCAAEIIFRLPFRCGHQIRVSQDGNGCGWGGCGKCGDPKATHAPAKNGGGAVDMPCPIGTPIVAPAPGVVLRVGMPSPPGSECYKGSLNCCKGSRGNYVLLDHGADTTTLFHHIDSATVKVGQRVNTGDQIAISGNTGCSTGPHLHLQVQSNCGNYWCRSRFFKVLEGGAGGGVLQACKTYTSQNCGGASPTVPAAPPAFCLGKTSGLYCSDDRKRLMRCRNGVDSVESTCGTVGCLVKPPGTPDVCNASPATAPLPTPASAAATCAGRTGAWCRDATALNDCNRKLIVPCERGCVVQPPGTPDFCAPPPAPAPISAVDFCRGRDGAWCRDATTLNDCNRKLISHCANGCEYQPPGIPDFCRQAPSRVADVAPPPPAYVPESTIANNLLLMHNSARKCLSLEDLVWDTDLELAARLYASECTYTHSPLEARGAGVGENMAMGAGNRWTADQLAQAWLLEASAFDCAANACTAGKQCGHWRQMIASGASPRVGCAATVCHTNSPFTVKEWTNVVCRYSVEATDEKRPFDAQQCASACPAADVDLAWAASNANAELCVPSELGDDDVENTFCECPGSDGDSPCNPAAKSRLSCDVPTKICDDGSIGAQTVENGCDFECPAPALTVVVVAGAASARAACTAAAAAVAAMLVVAVFH